MYNLYPKYKVHISSRFLELFIWKYIRTSGTKRLKPNALPCSPAPTCPPNYPLFPSCLYDHFLSGKIFESWWFFESVFSSLASLTIFVHVCTIIVLDIVSFITSAILITPKWAPFLHNSPSAYPLHYKTRPFISNADRNMTFFYLEKSSVFHHYFQKKVKYNKWFILWSSPSVCPPSCHKNQLLFSTCIMCPHRALDSHTVLNCLGNHSLPLPFGKVVSWGFRNHFKLLIPVEQELCAFVF